MITLLKDFYELDFLRNALLAGFLSSIVCGMIGTFVVVRKIGHIAGGISHSVLGGMGLAVFLGVSPHLGAFISAILTALIIGVISIRSQEQENTLINALWSIGMAIGIIFIHLTPGYSNNLMDFLFGNILTTTSLELSFLAGMCVFILLSVSLFFKQLQAICFDSEFTRLRGVPAHFFYFFLLILVSITIVLLIQMVGVILVIALLTLPAATSLFYFHSLKKIIAASIFLGWISSLSGLWISYELNTPAGATVVLVLGVFYFLSFIYKLVR